MEEVTKEEYDTYIGGLNNPTVETYNLCGKEKIYHKVDSNSVAIKTTNLDVSVYEVKKNNGQ